MSPWTLIDSWAKRKAGLWEVTHSYEENYGYQAVTKFKEYGIESSRYQKDSWISFFEIQGKRKWKS